MAGVGGNGQSLGGSDIVGLARKARSMFNAGLNRAPMSRRSTLATLVVVCLAAGQAIAQPPILPKKDKQKPPKPNQPAMNQPLDPAAQPGVGDLGEDLGDRILKKVRSRSWVLMIDVRVQGLIYAENVKGTLVPNQAQLSFSTAAVVFPVLNTTATSISGVLDPANLESELSFNNAVMDVNPKLQDGYASGTRLARWEMRQCEGRGWALKMKQPMTCSEIEFDEELAMKVPWPKGDWPAVAKSTFQPQIFVDYIEKPEEKAANDKKIQAFVKEKLGGKDPRSMPPALLAKTLFGAVVEYVQLSGQAKVTSKSGAFEGFDMAVAAEVLDSPRTHEHNIHTLLVSVFRNAGLPARLVYGWDLSETKDKNKIFLERLGNRAKIRSWVEFALVDPNPAGAREIWIPVDAVRQRNSGSRVPSIDRPWKYFGSNEDAEFLLPFAFQVHPPTTVYAHGVPAFYGWLTTPASHLNQAEQRITFTAITAPKRSGDPAPGQPQR